MFNPIFKENVQGRKHPVSCAFAEPELLLALTSIRFAGAFRHHGAHVTLL